jgi:hypothetical protein
MRALVRSLCVLVAALMLPAASGAEDQRMDVENIDALMEELVLSKMLSLECEVPNFQPLLVNLKRVWTPNVTELRSMFLGDEPAAILGEQSMESPLWGKGTRIKSGTVIYVPERGGATPTSPGSGTMAVEVVPTFLDVYSTGFVYANNIPHKAVYATDVEITDQSGASVASADINPDEEFNAAVSYRNVYEVDEGKQAAIMLINEMLGELTVGSDFRMSENALIQTFGERLFVYRAWPEYLTEYNVYENTGVILGPDADSADFDVDPKMLSTHPVAVPVHDVYVHLLLDGDKLLSGMEYFWNNELQASGTPQECIHAGTALANAPEQLFEYFDGEPPMLTVYNISLGYIQDRQDRRTLIPVWLFDAWYSQMVTAQDAGTGEITPLADSFARNHVSVPIPFAINALTGELQVL